MVAGALARRPGKGGHTWVFLNWLLGLKRLGCDVMFVDDLEYGVAQDALGQRCPVEQSMNWRFLRETMDGFGLGGSYSLRADGGRVWLGRSRHEVIDFAASAALLFNFMGYFEDPCVLAAVPMHAFVDIDPGFGQMWKELDQADIFSGHDVFITVGQNIGRPGCIVPTCGLDWLTIRPPVVLDLWPVASCPPATAGHVNPPKRCTSEPFTSVCTWRGPFAPVEFADRTFGLRAHELRSLACLPRITGRRFELALDIEAADAADLSLLIRNGWKITPPSRVASDPIRYREYIQRSGAELLVAKQMYVATGGGWMSDRSVCYLASGKPVVAQDTGWTGHYNPDAGLLAFTTVDEAAAAVEAVCAEPRRHSAAARELAEDLFDSDIVLGGLLSSLGLR